MASLRQPMPRGMLAKLNLLNLQPLFVCDLQAEVDVISLTGTKIK